MNDHDFDKDTDRELAAEDEQRRRDREPKRRPTVNIHCGVAQGLQMRVHQIHEGFFGVKQQVPLGETITLNAGANPGIDKEFYDAWRTENKNLSIVTAGLITATDEEDPEEDRKGDPETENPAAEPHKEE